MSRGQKSTIEISHRTIVFTVLFLVFLYTIQQISGILIGIFIAYLISTAVNPLVALLEKIKVPRQISAIFVLLAILVLLASGIAAVIPPIVDQTTSFLTQLPQLLQNLGVQVDQNLISSQFGSIPQNAFKVIAGAFSNAVAVFAVLVISYYFLLERRQLPNRLNTLFGDGEAEIENLLIKIENRLGGWIRGQTLLCIIIGAAAYAGLFALSIPFAVPLAIIAGILETIPNIGPTISIVPAAIVGFTISPFHGFAVIALYFVIQQFENYLIVPFVMKKSIGLNPLVTIIALMVGLKLGGPLGAVLAIPLFLTAEVLFPYFYSKFKPQS
jgi:predicted PurR-regulated permease PerM